MVIKKNERFLLVLLCIVLLFNFVFTTQVQAAGLVAISAATLAKFILLSGAAAIGIYGVSKADLSGFIDDFLEGSKYLDDKYLAPFSAWTYASFISLHDKAMVLDKKIINQVQGLLNDFTNYVKEKVVSQIVINNNLKIDDNGQKFVENNGQILQATDIYNFVDNYKTIPNSNVIINLDDLSIHGTTSSQKIIYTTLLGTTVSFNVKHVKYQGDRHYSYEVYADNVVLGESLFVYPISYDNLKLIYNTVISSDGYVYGIVEIDDRTWQNKSYWTFFDEYPQLILEKYDVRDYISKDIKSVFNENITISKDSLLYDAKTAELTAPNANQMPIIGVLPADLGKSISHESSISIADIVQSAVVSDTYVARTAEYAKSIDYPHAPVLWKDITNQKVLERIAALEGELADYKTLPQELVLNPDLEIAKEFESQLADIKAQSIPPIDLELGDSKINWDILKNIKIPQKFPFSIPWDIYKIIAVLQVPQERPVFDFAIKDYKFSLDLGKYDEITKITRFFISLIWLGVMYTSFKRFKGD